MQENKVSIIVPVFNVEKYLEQCLDSIVNQTLKDIEIIIINDGSTDGSSEIIDKYKKKYFNIKVIEQKNAGLSAARNAGIKESKGKYMMFIDSDDFIDLDMVEILYTKAEKYNCPLIICDLLLYWNNKKNKKYNKLKQSEDKKYKKDELYKILLTRKLNCQVMNKLYRRDIWEENNLSFEVGRYYEDIFPSFICMNIYKEAMFINDSMYKYRIREGSITASSSPKKVSDFIRSIQMAKDYLKNNSDINKSELNKYIMCFNINYGLYAMELNKRLILGEDLKGEILDGINLHYNLFKVVFNSEISIKTKIKYFMYRLGVL